MFSGMKVMKLSNLSPHWLLPMARDWIDYPASQFFPPLIQSPEITVLNPKSDHALALVRTIQETLISYRTKDGPKFGIPQSL